MLCATHLINRTPLTVLNQQSPFEKLYGMKPSYNMMKTFGCPCFMTTLKRGRTKFDPRANPCLFIGYSTKQKGYKIYNFFSKTVSVSKDVQFYEHCFPYHQGPSFINQMFLPNKTSQSTLLQEDPIFDELFQQMEQSDPKGSGTEQSDQIHQHDTLSKPHSDSELHIDLRKSSRSHKTPSHLEDYVCNANLHWCNIIQYCALNSTHKQIAELQLKYTEPKNYSEACTDPLWIEAMEKELKALNENKT